MGFTDKYIGAAVGRLASTKCMRLREKNDIFPVYKMIDTCASEFDAYVPYFYSTYEEENESRRQPDKQKIIVLGSGPIRIGQGVEFDYSHRPRHLGDPAGAATRRSSSTTTPRPSRPTTPPATSSTSSR